MEVSIGTIKIKSSNGEEVEHTFTIPKKVSDDIMCEIIDWKNRWLFSPYDYDKYLENKDKFQSKLS